MNWTENRPPIIGECNYDHTICETPLGKIIIEWKSWKEYPDFGVTIGNEYIETAYSLEEAKEIAKMYLTNKQTELSKFLNTSNKKLDDLINWMKSDLAEDQNPKLAKTMTPYRTEKIKFLNKALKIIVT